MHGARHTAYTCGRTQASVYELSAGLGRAVSADFCQIGPESGAILQSAVCEMVGLSP